MRINLYTLNFENYNNNTSFIKLNVKLFGVFWSQKGIPFCDKISTSRDVFGVFWSFGSQQGIPLCDKISTSRDVVG